MSDHSGQGPFDEFPRDRVIILHDPSLSVVGSRGDPLPTVKATKVTVHDSGDDRARAINNLRQIVSQREAQAAAALTSDDYDSEDDDCSESSSDDTSSTSSSVRGFIANMKPGTTTTTITTTTNNDNKEWDLQAVKDKQSKKAKKPAHTKSKTRTRVAERLAEAVSLSQHVDRSKELDALQDKYKKFVQKMGPFTKAIRKYHNTLMALEEHRTKVSFYSLH